MNILDLTTLIANIVTIVGLTGAVLSSVDFFTRRKREIQTDLINRYNSWLDEFKSDKKILYTSRINLNTVLQESDGLKNIDGKNFLIPYHDLFIEIQKGLMYFKDKHSELFEWIEITEIVLNSKKINNLLEYLIVNNELSIISSIDFQKRQNYLTDNLDVGVAIEFLCCKFILNDLLKQKKRDNSLKLINCCFDCEINSDNLKKLNEIGIELENDIYFIPDSYDKNKYIERRVRIENKKIESSQEYSDKPLIYENRDLSHFPINEYILKGSTFDVTIDSNDGSSINNRILESLKSQHREIFQKDSNKINVSRSKNFLPDMNNTDHKKWKWHSWNVLPSVKVDSENDFEYFVFAVNIDNNKYTCIVIEKSKMKELIQLKTLSKDNRYFFYFAEKVRY